MDKLFVKAVITAWCLLCCGQAFSDEAMDAAMRESGNMDLVVVPFPAVPDNWTLDILDNTVLYYSPVRRDKGSSDSVVRITYTKNTSGKDSLGYLLDYTRKHQCTSPNQVGYGFYTTSCSETDTYAISIGEPNNLYFIELTGDLDRSCEALIEGYVRSIITGKHTFKDRYIGDVK